MRRRRTNLGEQLELRPRTWGGRRPGAGRPSAEHRTTEPHRARPAVVGRHPLHVVQRVVPGLIGLRRRAGYRAIDRALRAVLGRADFRVVHVSIQRTHLHLLVEADDQRALAIGMQVFTAAAARALNAAAGRARGTVFPQRYHATPITCPRQARNELAYVLNNWRRHAADRGRLARIDRYSSAIRFDGWKGIGAFLVPADYQPLRVAAPRSWLLAEGWRRGGGEIAVDEVPGARRRRREEPVLDRATRG